MSFGHEIVGWRVWELDSRTNSLVSPGMDAFWPKSGALRAICLSRFHAAPGPSVCACGIWATRFAPPILGPILGLVQLWGVVAVHGEEGWRGEFARPIALVNQVYDNYVTQFLQNHRDLPERVIDKVAKAYGVPVIDPGRAGWRVLARELGAPSLGWLGPPPHLINALKLKWSEKRRLTVFCTCGWEDYCDFSLDMDENVLAERKIRLGIEHYKQQEQNQTRR